MEAMLTDNRGKNSELEGALQATLLRKGCCKISTSLEPSWKENAPPPEQSMGMREHTRQKCAFPAPSK